MNQREIRVLVVDDHPVFRDGIRQLLDDSAGFAAVGEAADGAEALAFMDNNDVDLVLMDLSMPGVDGVTAIERLRQRDADTRVLVLSTYDTEEYVLPAIRAGATGYLLKDSSRTELLRGIRSAASGETVLAPSAARHLVADARRERPLSHRELSLLRLVARGATNAEAARELFVSEATVKAYLQRIYRELGARDRASAVAAAYRAGLLD
ncbi:MAG TPA: response regulator transcription factor [Stackebrandtia sp.]|jgi:DNA-binding NarL/FixJ family response regulator|uniref:response regulator transcription factor n=1 Tax=Stackebrandtia sp. TaxID=2023065 RepID=UPI002D49FC3C|nr:response regulator transcription factor [Stackebrandtia sp.]HZE37229.1 response regulator transcription factor [Stackebrandtia sp.]